MYTRIYKKKNTFCLNRFYYYDKHSIYYNQYFKTSILILLFFSKQKTLRN